MSFFESWPIRRTRPHEQNSIDTTSLLHWIIGIRDGLPQPGDTGRLSGRDVQAGGPSMTWGSTQSHGSHHVPSMLKVSVEQKQDMILVQRCAGWYFHHRESRGWAREAISICQLNVIYIQYKIIMIKIRIKTIVIIVVVTVITVVIIVIVIILVTILVIMLVITIVIIVAIIIIVIIVIINVSAVPGLKMIETQKQEQTLL